MSIVLLVEDEVQQGEVLKKAIENSYKETQVLHAYDVKQAWIYIKKYHINLFIIDIGLPDDPNGRPGIKLAEEIRNLPEHKLTWLLFISGLPKNECLPDALHKAHCYDFISKPYNIQQVLLTINNLLDNKIVPKKSTPTSGGFLTVKTDGILYNIPFEDIRFIEVNNRDCFVNTCSYTYNMKRKLTITEASRQLPSNKFIQCHKSFIVNIGYVHTIKSYDGIYKISLLNSSYKLPIGEKYHKALLNAIQSSSTFKE